MDEKDGCEFGRILNQRFDDHVDRQESKLEGIETYLRVLLEVKMPKVESAVGEAVKMARDSSECTVEARKAAESAKDSVRNVIIGIVLAVLSLVGTNAYKIWSDKQDQGAVLRALNDKLHQDAINQRETVNYLKQLEATLRRAAMKKPSTF